MLDSSTKPMSLHRVPPNLLVGPGATDFAHTMGVPVLPHDFLVSPASRERWKRWIRDLKAAEKEDLKSEIVSGKLRELSESRHQSELPPYLSGVWNESQPYSPRQSATSSPGATDASNESISTCE